MGVNVRETSPPPSTRTQIVFTRLSFPEVLFSYLKACNDVTWVPRTHKCNFPALESYISVIKYTQLLQIVGFLALGGSKVKFHSDEVIQIPVSCGV